MDTSQIKGTPKRGLLGTTLGFFFGFAAVSLYEPTSVNLKDTIGLTDCILGLLMAK